MIRETIPENAEDEDDVSDAHKLAGWMETVPKHALRSKRNTPRPSSGGNGHLDANNLPDPVSRKEALRTRPNVLKVPTPRAAAMVEDGTMKKIENWLQYGTVEGKVKSGSDSKDHKQAARVVRRRREDCLLRAHAAASSSGDPSAGAVGDGMRYTSGRRETYLPRKCRLELYCLSPETHDILFISSP
eukprot:CAMPEP_0196733202 /NCGR_PEP_ID=MMETSP1091-20130531/12366_1 /TAXON_ID=302021 /ORGANISM="Rhodomonas sp., Strain CCMP768" /LENGTH=186 /DNA_ID=CAMNT_0042076559 /DNA_START=37 /DNA_END=596 /DNA_ORIENTATION=-